jgi:hypothetical protein
MWDYCCKELKRLTQIGDNEIVDFNEEFSAFHSPSIQDQAHYVAHSIRYIISRYPSPRSIVLLGHSMGGIVARLCLTLVQSGYDEPRDDISNLVAAIITMSTPHAMPPVSIDSTMEKIYADINAYWEQGVQVPVLVSICGGTADTQISSDACVLPQHKNTSHPVTGDSDTFTVFSTGMHGIWTGVDHQAMVWCDQIRSRVARAVLGLQAVLSKRNKDDARDDMVEILRTEFLGQVPTSVLRPSSPSRTLPSTGVVTLTPQDPVVRGRSGGTHLVECSDGGDGGCTLQLLGEFSIRGIGPDGKPALDILTGDRPGGNEQDGYAPAGLDTIEILPPSVPVSSHAPLEAFPLPGEGVRADAGLTFVQLRFLKKAIIVSEPKAWAVVGMQGDHSGKHSGIFSMGSILIALTASRS